MYIHETNGPGAYKARPRPPPRAAANKPRMGLGAVTVRVSIPLSTLRPACLQRFVGRYNLLHFSV